MGHHLAARQRQIKAKGRKATLRRLPNVDVELWAFIRGYRPNEIQGGIQMGDATAQILNDEIAHFGWPAPIVKSDRLILPEATYAIQMASPLFEGAMLIGWRLWLR